MPTGHALSTGGIAAGASRRRSLHRVLMTQLTHLAPLIRKQGGVLHRHQALSLGFSEDQIDYRLEVGSWTRLVRSVYLVDAAPRTWRAWAFAAVLAAGTSGVLAGRTAAQLRQWAPATLPVTVAVPPDRRVRLDTPNIHVLRLHTPDADRVVVDGLPTTTRLRTAVDIAHLLPVLEAQPLLDRMLVLDAVRLDELTGAIASSRRSGSANARALMRSAADEAAAESERHARRLLQGAGVTGWTSNHSVAVRGARSVKVDLALKRYKIALEIKGWLFHSKNDRARADDTRVTDLQLAGWLVIPVGWAELMGDPDEVVAKVRAAIAARSAAVA